MEKYQTVIPRFFAILVDTVIVWGIIYLYENFILNTKASISIAIIWTIITLIFANVYNIYLTCFYGQTLGKMLMKVKVVDISEIPVTFCQAVLRRLVDFLFDTSNTIAEIYIVLTIGLDADFSNTEIIKLLA
jgi:uncharacterized RDD family membrane protein YckC